MFFVDPPSECRLGQTVTDRCDRSSVISRAPRWNVRYATAHSKQHDDAVAEANQHDDVQEEPGQPADRGRTSRAHGRSAIAEPRPTIAMLPEIAIDERHRRLAAHAAQDVLRGVRRALHRRLRDAGKQLAALMQKRRRIADDEHLGMSGNREIGLDERRGRRDRAARRASPRAATRRRRPPRRPCRRRAARLAEPSRRARRCRVTRDALAHLDAEPRQRLAAPRRAALGKRRQNRRPASTSTMRARAVSMARNSSRSVCRAISASVPASSTPVGPPPTSTNVSSSRWRAGSVSRSARSNASRMRRRIAIASSSVFSPGAYGSHSSWPK